MSIRINDQQIQPDKAYNAKSETASDNKPVASLDVKKVDSIPSSLLRGAYGVIPFQGIRNIQANTHSNVSFGANPLYDINLKKIVGEDLIEQIPAKFSQLVLKNEDDTWAMINIEDIWSKIAKTDYTGMITKNFIDAKKPERAYYVVESGDTSKELFDRLTCIMETTNPKTVLNKDYFEVHFLQSHPDIVNKAPGALKGSGELSLYGAVRVAKENGFKKVQLFSSNDGFYDKMGFVKTESISDEAGSSGGMYELSSDMFDSFLKKIEEKYKLK